MIYFIVSWCLVSCCAYSHVTVTASPLFTAEEKMAEKEIVQETAQQSVVPKSVPSHVEESSEKAPPVGVKKKVLLKTKYQNSKRSAKKSKRAATQRA